jgi:hypothetical protein
MEQKLNSRGSGIGSPIAGQRSNSADEQANLALMAARQTFGDDLSGFFPIFKRIIQERLGSGDTRTIWWPV